MGARGGVCVQEFEQIERDRGMVIKEEAEKYAQFMAAFKDATAAMAESLRGVRCSAGARRWEGWWAGKWALGADGAPLRRLLARSTLRTTSSSSSPARTRRRSVCVARSLVRMPLLCPERAPPVCLPQQPPAHVTYQPIKSPIIEHAGGGGVTAPPPMQAPPPVRAALACAAAGQPARPPAR
jgi:hypothetical protein